MTPASPALQWRLGLPETSARYIADNLVAQLDALGTAVREAALDKIEKALAAGVCDPTTLEVITEVVAASH